MGLKEKVRELGLEAPASFWNTDEATLAMMVGGCGPGDGIGDFLVPDTVYFLSIRPACAVHDYMYAVGKSFADKQYADLVFLANMLRIVNTESKFKVVRVLRRYRIMTYYSAVVEGGAGAFKRATI